MQRILSALKYLRDRNPAWKLLLFGGKSMGNWAPKTRNAQVAPRLCPHLCFAESVIEAHAYILRIEDAAAGKRFLDDGSAADLALCCLMRAHVGECFRLNPNAISQDRKLSSDIRKNRTECNVPAAATRKQGAEQVATRKKALPQCRATASSVRKTWLKNTQLAMKAMKAMKARRGRGSHTMCRGKYATCMHGQAKQATALCHSCQTRLSMEQA